jgi:hypothetical protein
VGRAREGAKNYFLRNNLLLLYNHYEKEIGERAIRHLYFPGTLLYRPYTWSIPPLTFHPGIESESR